MGRVNGNFIEYDRFYHKMIGDREFSPEEAYIMFYNFLKDFKFIGTFHYYMNRVFGSFSQNYKKFFIERIINYQSHCDRINANTRMHGGTDIYHWYRDIVLLFPFAFNDNEYYADSGSISYTKVQYMKEMWKLYCQEQKLIYSIIQLEDEEDDEDIDNAIENWEKILENCGYSV